jgi:quinol monooxygenase YgiN
MLRRGASPSLKWEDHSCGSLLLLLMPISRPNPAGIRSRYDACHQVKSAPRPVLLKKHTSSALAGTSENCLFFARAGGHICRGRETTNREAHMILEIAQIDVKPGTEAEFEAGVKKAVPVFKRQKGCKSLALQRSIEKPSRFRLFIHWDTVENHTVDFRGSADFQEWRKLVGHCFASPPEVEHVSEVTKGF